MKLPKSIKLLGRDVGIEVIEDELKNEKGENLGGCYEHHNRRIIIQSDQSDMDIFETICHEAAHNYLIQLGLDQKMDDREVEVWCQVFTLFVVDVIRGFSEEEKTTKKATNRKKKTEGKKR